MWGHLVPVPVQEESDTIREMGGMARGKAWTRAAPARAPSAGIAAEGNLGDKVAVDPDLVVGIPQGNHSLVAAAAVAAAAAAEQLEAEHSSQPCRCRKLPSWRRGGVGSCGRGR